MIISIVSGKGSPGASTLAVGMTLCWPRPVLLVDADPAGGAIALGYAAGVDLAGRSLTGVRVAARRSSMTDAIWANVVALDGNRWLLAGAPHAQQEASVDYPALAGALADLGIDVIVDAGRIPASVRHEPIWSGADLVLLAMRSTLPAVHAAQNAAALAPKSAGSPSVRSVIVGPGRPYSTRDVRIAMVDVAPVVGELAWDPPAAGVLVDAVPARRRLGSLQLMRSVARLVRHVVAVAEPEAAGETGASSAHVAGPGGGAAADRTNLGGLQRTAVPAVAAMDVGGTS